MAENLWATDSGVYFGYQVAPPEDADEPLQSDWRPSGREHRYTGDRHLVTVGPNGSGKTRRLLIPNLIWLQNWSALVVDVKGTLAALTGPYRASLPGHTVIVVDPFAVLERDYPRLVARYPFLKSAGFNPVAALDPDSDDFPDDAKALAEAVVPVENREHPHWEKSGQSLAAGLVMADRIDGKGATLVAVRDWVGLEAETLAREIKSEILPRAQGNEAVAAKLNRFTKISGENRELFSILSTVQTHTEWLDSKPIRRAVSNGNADFGQMKFSPTTVYLILPPRYLASHATWLRLMVTAVLQPLMRSVRPAKVPVLFMLDEFAQLGHLPIIENNLGLMREYGVKLWPVFQDLAQAKDIYETRWESFVGNAGVLHTFAPQDVTTRDYLSKLSGLRLYWLKTASQSGGRSIGPQASISSGWQEGLAHMQGPVYWPQNLAAMGDGQAVLFSRGRAPRAFLPDPSEIPGVRDILVRAAREIG